MRKDWEQIIDKKDQEISRLRLKIQERVSSEQGSQKKNLETVSDANSYHFAEKDKIHK